MRTVVVVVLAVDAALLALTELAWLTLRVGGTALPVAAAVAAVSTPLLVRAADHARPGTRAPFMPLAGWLVPVLVVGLWSPAGAGVLPPDGRALLLIAAGLLPAVFVAVRPVHRGRGRGHAGGPAPRVEPDTPGRPRY